MSRDSHSAKSFVSHQVVSLFTEAILQVVNHSEAEEAVGILLLHLLEIVVLYAVDKFLYHNGSTYLSIVHVRKKHLCRVASVNHKRRQHLHLFAQEDRTTILRSADFLTVPRSILPQPQMAMGINNQEFFHLTNIWSPMIFCTSFTNSSSIGSLT